HHAFSSGAGRTSDGNGSHASTLKSPSYTKSVSWQHYLRDKYEGIPTTSIYYMTCLTVFIISVALLMVGLWNATLLLSEKGFYGLAFFLSLFGAVAVQKNIRDAGINPPKETQVTQEEYSE
ncbi:YiaA/YiaB family inner membrane protein, partial [Escherichia coli]|uniref:YiaA/YiaB family inner membrane protein n=1 Tax=Escherichia coli TaxID=562 RepID=UPI0020777913